MSLTVSTTIPIITPIYTPLEFVMSSPGADYMELDIYVGDASKAQYAGTKRTIRLITTSTTVDVQGIIQPFFSSDASAALNLKRMDIHAHSITSGVDTSAYVDCYWLFNGCKRDSWDPSTYILDNVGLAKFMNNWNAPINIHWGDNNSKLYMFAGTFTNSTGSYVANAPVIRVKKDGALSSGYAFASSATPRLNTLNIGPTSLNTLISGLDISSNTLSYTIDPSQNTTSFGLMTVNIIPDDDRYTYKRISYVDSMGCINYINFDLLQTNTITNSKQTYMNNGTYRQYNNIVSDAYTLTSNWITETESLSLKDLWFSPSVMIDGKYVLLQNKTVNIQTRRGVKLINYTVEYQAANEFKVQIN